MMECKTFLEAFDHWLSVHPAKSAFTFLDAQGDVLTRLTYAELDEQSRRLAHALLTRFGLREGDRVLLVYPPCLDFMVSFIACLRANVIAVPVFPPDPFHARRDCTIFQSIQQSSGAKIALTNKQYDNALQLAAVKNWFSGSTADLKALVTWHCTDDILTDQSISDHAISSSLSVVRQNRQSLAFLQYTSGSTSEPKGVMISHANLAHNLTLIITGLQAVSDTIVVSWLPQYHDMGLIGSYLGALYCGGCGFYFSPMAFIKQPLLWPLAMSKYRATHVQAPNFAYSLVAKKFLAAMRESSSSALRSQLDALDLSSLRHMINAAEPVDQSTLQLFSSTFSPYKLPDHVLFPTYGLAEHTVYVVSNGKQVLSVDKYELEAGKVVECHSASKHTRSIVGCGRVADSADVDVQIVNPDSRKALGENVVGEVWIHSPSKAGGYWSLPDKSKEDFHAQLQPANDSRGNSGSTGGHDGYLRTGDLGFLHRGELFICGRLKDTIIIRGKNYYPHDIERVGENAQLENTCWQLRKGCSAAISTQILGQEVVLYLAEVTDQVMQHKAQAMKSVTRFVDQLRSEVTAMNGLTLSFVALLPPRTILKTSSGKIARQWVKKAYFEGSLPYLHVWSNLDASDSLEHSTVSADNGQSAAELQVECLSPDVAHSDRIDPTALPFPFVLQQLKIVFAQCAGLKDIKEVDEHVPLARFGLDSMQGIQLQSQLESKFTVQLPDELLFDSDATLTSIAKSLVSGGQFAHRPILINGVDVFNAYAKKHHNADSYLWIMLKNALNALLMRKKPVVSTRADTMTAQWLLENQVKADIDSLRFVDGVTAKPMAMTQSQELDFIFYAVQIYGIFFLIPLLIYVVHRFLAVHWAVLVWTLLLLLVYGVNHEAWPPAFRGHPSFGSVLTYFSYRMIIEAPVSAYQSVPSIYTFGPHGVFGIQPTIQAMLNGLIVGENFHILGANAIFWVPFYNALCKMLGFHGVDRKSFSHLLKQGHSVGIIPGGIAEMFVTSPDEETLVVQNRKGFVALALQHGTQIVPCYCFGNTHTFRSYNSTWLQAISRATRMSLILFWGRWCTPVPLRVPMLTVMGKPIVCPKVEHPSQELVNEYHELFLRETRRIYDNYKNTYNWQTHKLTFKR